MVSENLETLWYQKLCWTVSLENLHFAYAKTKVSAFSHCIYSIIPLLPTVMIKVFGQIVQTVQTHIRMLLEEQSDQGFDYLLFHLHLFEEIP